MQHRGVVRQRAGPPDRRPPPVGVGLQPAKQRRPPPGGLADQPLERRATLARPAAGSGSTANGSRAPAGARYRALFPDPARTRRRRGGAVCARSPRGPLRRGRGRRRRLRLGGGGGVALSSAVRGPRHHRRSLAAGPPLGVGADRELPHPPGQPRGRLRRRTGRLAVSLRPGRPGQAAARAGRRRRAPKPRGHRPGGRPAQRRAPVHEPAAAGLHRPAQPARGPPPRGRRARGRPVRGGPPLGDVALPARHPARVRAEPLGRRWPRSSWREGRGSTGPRGSRTSPSSSPTPPSATGTARYAGAIRSAAASGRAPCSPSSWASDRSPRSTGSTGRCTSTCRAIRRPGAPSASTGAFRRR